MTDTASPNLDLLLLAVTERAPVDSEVAEEVARTMRDFDAAIDLTLGDGAAITDDAPSPLAYALTAAILGLRLRIRTGVDAASAGAVLFDRIHQPQP